MLYNTLLWLASTALVTAAPHSARSALACTEIDISVNISSPVLNLPNSLNLLAVQDPSFLSKFVAGLGSTIAAGQYSIGARYCEPTTNVASRRNTLQVLVHGSTYTKDYWSGLAPPGTQPGQDQYSWILYAANQGYPTLSVDRLCNGGSTRGLSAKDCQLPTQAEALHSVLQSARLGTLPIAQQRSFNKIIYAGHSYGAMVGNALSIQHPDAVDSYLMTGFSFKLLQGQAGVIVQSGFQPAAVALPNKYGHLDPGYVTSTNGPGVRSVFYHGDFDDAVFQQDFSRRGTLTVAEVYTATFGQVNAPNYTGSVFVLNGNEDGVFCEDGPLQAVLGVAGDCSKGFSEGVRDGYPNARAFGFYNTANTGHCLNTHRTAQESFKAAHDWLGGQGF